MNLFLLRHGLAVEPGTGGFHRDSERPLTPKGERRLWRIAEGMESMGLSFDLLLSSPYLRARQTAEIVAEAFDARKRLEFSDTLTPGGSHKGLIELLSGIRPAPNDVLLVGHEPNLSELVSLLAGGDRGLSVVIRKSGLCKLAAETLRNGRCATLEWLLTPKQLRLMA